MPIVTESDLRTQLRRPQEGATVSMPPRARLSPSALDFVRQWKLTVVETAAPTPDATPRHDDGATWDKPAEFPVNLTGDIPTCVTCGTAVRGKPSALTQLNAHHYAPKTHPRIILRGRFDSLLALTMMAQRHAFSAGEDGVAEHLGTLAAYCRELTSAEYWERPAETLVLRGVTADELHKVTHDPDGTLGIPHLTIDGRSPELQHWLNMCRTSSRELEILALQTYPSPDDEAGASICHAMNRLSSAFYYVQLLLQAGRT